jgi:hypothetical protein
MALAAAESRMSFIYGLISGPILFSLGGLVFLLIERWRTNSRLRAAAAMVGHAGSYDRRASDRFASAKPYASNPFGKDLAKPAPANAIRGADYDVLERDAEHRPQPGSIVDTPLSPRRIPKGADQSAQVPEPVA